MACGLRVDAGRLLPLLQGPVWHSALVEDQPSSVIYTGFAPSPAATITAWIDVKPRKKYWLIVWVPRSNWKVYGDVTLQFVSVWTAILASNVPSAPAA